MATEFYPASRSSYAELEDRREARKHLKRIGISFLDDALIGIGRHDLLLIGAPSGIGKTQLCCQIAKANIDEGRRVHFIPLEADQYEIERRLKYQIVSRLFFSMSNRPSLGGKRLEYDSWELGDFIDDLAQIEVQAIKEFEEKYSNLFLQYKTDKYDCADLIESVIGNADKSDLFIIDHAHYFDFDDDNENRAIKKLAKTVRQLAIDEGRPIVLVAHLRKRDRGNPELVAGLDEFHGSSDLAKIATRVVTLAQGDLTDKGNYETFFRVPKNRKNGGSKFFIARMIFNPSKGCYENEYRLGPATLTREIGFKDIPRDHAPQWAKGLVFPEVGSVSHSEQRAISTSGISGRKKSIQNRQGYFSENEK